MNAYLFIVITLAGLLPAQVSYGFFSGIWNYVSQYQLGLEYSRSFDRLRLDYTTGYNAGLLDSCAPEDEQSERLACSVDMIAGSSSGFGIFLQRAFERRSNFHLRFDINLNLRYLNGQVTESEAERLQADGLPLTTASFDLASFILLPYIQVGYTPAGRFPDFLLSMGPAIQAVVGEARIGESRQDVATIVTSNWVGYTELEMVVLRFGKGAFSLYAARENVGREGTPFFRDIEDEDITDINVRFQRGTGGNLFGFGAKLLLNWP